MPTADHTLDFTPLAPGGPADASDGRDDVPGPPSYGGHAADRRRRFRRRALAGLLAIVAVGGGTAWYVAHRVTAPILGTGCTVVAGGETVTLDADQASNAAIITAVAVQRNLPARAATIAIATALQESKLRNLTYGDRDSLGLFQQRPSQGWGTKAEVTDPVYASNAFYDVLVKIEGYRTLSVTKAAQKVQRSAFPSAYAAHEAEARVLASALSGYSPGAFTCVLGTPTGGSERPAANGLTPRANAVAKAAERELGATVTASGAKGTSLELHLPAASTVTAWAVAQWAVARSQPLQIVAVGTATNSWSRNDNPNKWVGQGVSDLALGHVIVQVS
jgi:hypothetical protein